MKLLLIAIAIGLVACLASAVLKVDKHSSLAERCRTSGFCPDVVDERGRYEERGWPASFIMQSEGGNPVYNPPKTELNAGAFALNMLFWTTVSFGAITVFNRTKK